MYCSDQRRRECGKTFESSTREEKFRSRDCYVRNGIWRKEDTEEVMKQLLAGKNVPKILKWIKELLGE